MFCKYCGSEIDDGSKFCNSCGGDLTSDNGNKINLDYSWKYHKAHDIRLYAIF